MSQYPSTPPPPPGYAPPPAPEPAKKAWYKRWWGITLIVLIALTVIGQISNALGGDKADEATVKPLTSNVEKSVEPTKEPAKAESTAPAKTTAPAKAEEPKDDSPRLGSKVRDGKFEFVVTKVQPGVKSVGSDVLGKKAQGQFVILTIKVTNIGKDPQTFFGDNMKLTDNQERNFSADTEAMIYMGDQGSAILSEINPGNSLTVQVPFDLPKGAKPSEVELHDSAFSGGVKVKLS